MSALTIQGSEIHAVSPEGKEATMPLDALYQRVAGVGMETGSMVLPDGVKAVKSDGPITVWVHQTPPRVYKLKWIAKDSPERYGKGCKYRDVVISLPYLVVLAVFNQSRKGFTTLSKQNECFFTNKPLSSLDDTLFYPALLNCSKFEPPEGKPLSWICTQHLDRGFDTEEDTNTRMRLGFKALMHCLLEAGFNYSSEEHEASSWFTESASVDPRVADIDDWQKATAEDRFFALELDWLPTGKTVSETIQRIFKYHGASRPKLTDATAIQKLVFTHNLKKRRRKLADAPGLASLIQEQL